MAVLSKLPSEAVISSFKGVVDFYLWKGIPCARKWPTWPKRQAYPEERANQDDFAYANKLFSQLPDYLQQQYRNMAASTSFTGKDLFIRAYMKGIDY